MRTLQIAMLAAIGTTAAIGGGAPPPVRTTGHESTTTRLGPSEYSLLRGARQFNGLLIDAGCADRSAYNLGLPSEPFSAAIAQPNAQANGAAGITVSPQILQSERADITPHQVIDMRARQADPTCAITASTTAFGLLMPNGQLMNLDPGGNTFAWQAVQSTAEGRAMLNGMGAGLKPYANLTGVTEGSTIVVQTIGSLEARLGSAATTNSATRINSRQ